MALTKGVQPIRPTGPPWGSSAGAHPVLTMPMAASTAILQGDCLVQTSGLAVVGNAAPAKDTILGFAAGTQASSASVDTVLIYPALAQSVFDGNMIGGTNTDRTGAAANADMGVGYELVASTVVAGVNPVAYAAINQAATTATVALPLYYTRQRDNTLGVRSGVGVVNPRCAFIVMSSVFQHLA